MLIASYWMAIRRINGIRSQTQCSIKRFGKSALHTSAEKSPVLRFAPSPTGQLHLGGLRTALFNHLFARSQGGKWILRIEDTDQKRLVPGAVEAMQDILKWIGLDYDEGPDKSGNRGPYIQSQRLDLYRKYAERLLQSGRAYRDFRISSSKDMQNGNNSNEYLTPDEQEAKRLEKEGRPYVIRFKIDEKDIAFDDAVYGHLKFPYDRTFEDPILVKSTGWPTYHLANIVDDTEMGITHVFRGEEWLPSMPIHLNLYNALNTTPPKFVHLPLLINPDGSKLSKRHADVHVESYRKAGYEPQALLNFVALMGFNWHLPDSKSEVFNMEEMINQFKLDRISQSRACPDLSKLRFLNKNHFSSKIEKANKDERKEMISELITLVKEKETNSSILPLLTEDRLQAIFEVIVKRNINLSEAADETVNILSPISFDNADVVEIFTTFHPASFAKALQMAKEHLFSIDQQTFKTHEGVDSILKPVVKQFDKQTSKESSFPKHGKGRTAFFKAIRFAWTGKSSGPTLGEIMWILGKEQCISRIEESQKMASEKS